MDGVVASWEESWTYTRPSVFNGFVDPRLGRCAGRFSSMGLMAALAAVGKGVSASTTAARTTARNAAPGTTNTAKLASDANTHPPNVAPRTTRVYSSGADALEGGAISLDDATRVASENRIDMWAISLQYEGGAPSNLYGFTSMDGAGNIVRAPDGRYIVTLADAGLSSPGSALNTIAHELNHIREISRTHGFHIPEEAGAMLAGDLAELFMRGG